MQRLCRIIKVSSSIAKRKKGRVLIKVLNLYAGIGGNRKLWKNVDVTAVELNREIASIYHDFFPTDKVIVEDAHKYLLEHFEEYDFIWSSPPCPTHSQLRFNLGYLANRKYKKSKPVYPDMDLYQEIIILMTHFKGLWCVENTVPYYEPLIPCIKTAGHVWWANFFIGDIGNINRNHRGGTVASLEKRKGFDLSTYTIKNKRLILRNCVEPEVGFHIFNESKKKAQPDLFKQ